MPYQLGQYSQATVKANSNNVNNIYVHLATGSTDTSSSGLVGGGVAARKKGILDLGVITTDSDESILFADECVYVNSSFNRDYTYYLHGKIKRLTQSQTFDVYLVNATQSDGIDGKTQYIKTISVKGGDEKKWVDFEFLFTPLEGEDFNCIVFKLHKRRTDLFPTDDMPRRLPVFIYEELSIVNNIIKTNILTNVDEASNGMIKIGVQSHPGLMMCINQEEIHIGKSGIYELRDGLIRTKSFSAIVAALEQDVSFSEANKDASYPEEIRFDYSNYTTMDDFLNAVVDPSINKTIDYDDSTLKSGDLSFTNSVCIFNHPKMRATDPFILDYMYEYKLKG